MHPYDLLYRGLNLTEPAADNDGLVRTAMVTTPLLLIALLAVPALIPMPDVAANAAALALIPALFAVPIAVFAHATNRARRLRVDDIIDMSLLDATLVANHDGLTLTSNVCTFSVWRDNRVWRRRQRSNPTPESFTLPLGDQHRDTAAQWVIEAGDTVDVTVTFHPARSGRIDDIAHVPVGELLELTLQSGRAVLHATFE